MKRTNIIGLTIATLALSTLLAGCNEDTPQSTSGVQKATVSVPVDPVTGLTVEQRNIKGRLLADNTPGSIKHLYIVAPESGQVIIYSTVQGKVTSSGKRLSPSTVNGSTRGFLVRFGNDTHYTSEVLGDDGTYGSSGEYLYWLDTKGIYHQHYLTGGQIITLSDQPVQVKSVIINMEVTQTSSPASTFVPPASAKPAAPAPAPTATDGQKK